MKELTIEWRHYDRGGATCDRCAATGSSLEEVIAGISTELALKGIAVRLVETKLTEDLMAQSNMILFNGVPLEAVLEEASASETQCQSCSCLTGAETNCRAVDYRGQKYEEIPAELIRKAAHRSIESL